MPDRLAKHAIPQVVWLFGHPVGHSLSPTMQNAAFRHEGVDALYIARDVQKSGLPAAIEGLRTPETLGANLTMPHKEAALPLLDEIADDGRRIGAVNTIVSKDGRLVGHNTDLGGFLQAVKTVMPSGAKGLGCLVLGAGGAARAVLAGLMQDGAERVWVANRNRDRAETLCDAAREWGRTECAVVSLGDARSVVDDCELVVNATSLGLSDSVKELPIDVDTLHSGQVVVDLVYGMHPTALVEAAKAKGLTAIDGKEMLVQQASLSHELWTGLEAPLDVMRGSIGGC